MIPLNKLFIIVKFDLEGMHYWPDAPNEYAVLRSPHGHVFHFEAQIPVTASRQIEFLEARRRLMGAMKAFYGSEPCDFGSMSCEDLANALIDCVRSCCSYSCGVIARVFEDAFVGAEVQRLEVK